MCGVEFFSTIFINPDIYNWLQVTLDITRQVKITNQLNQSHTGQSKIKRNSHPHPGPTKTRANMLSSREYITWSAFYVIEHIAIVTFNAITIVAFMKNCQLRKRSTYLILNLAVVDMAVGFTGFWSVYELGLYCKLWKGSLKWWEHHPVVSARIIRMTFFLCSLINITIISLERLHATVRPFRPRFVKKRVYWVIIAVSNSSIDFSFIPSYPSLLFSEATIWHDVLIYVSMYLCSIFFLFCHLYQSQVQPSASSSCCGWYGKKINSDAVLCNLCLSTYVAAVYCTVFPLLHNRHNFQVVSFALNLLGRNIIDTQLSCKSYTVCN